MKIPLSKRINLGFTLIELMIVIALIGLLTIIAIPNYQSYTNKAKFTEIIQATAPFKLAVEICFHTIDTLTHCSNELHGIPPAIKSSTKKSYIESIFVKNGIITATSQNISHKSLTYQLTPEIEVNTGRLIWSVSGSCIAAGIC
ncbi:MAG: Fimbrial protein [Legionellaceae bacterium]